MTLRLSNFIDGVVQTSDVLLLYIPLLFLIFPQEAGYWPVQVIFWCLPLGYLGLILSRPRYLHGPIKSVISLVALFLTSVVVSTIFSLDKAQSLLRLSDYLALFVYAFYFYLVITDERKFRTFNRLNVLVSFLLIGLAGFFQFFYPTASLPGINLFYTTYGHNQIIHFLVLVIPVVMSHPSIIKSKKLAYLCLLLLCLMWFGSFSRAAYLVSIVFLSGYLYLNSFKLSQRFKKISLLTVSGLILVVSLQVAVPLAAETGLISFTTDSRLEQQLIKPLRPRWAYWTQAIAAWSDTWLLGYGPGTFRFISAAYRELPDDFSLFAHSWFFTILSEQGLVGVAVLGVMVAALAHYAHSKPVDKISIQTWGLMAAVGGFLGLNLFDFGWQFTLPALVWLVLLLKILSQPSQIKNVSRRTLGLVLLPVCLYLIGYASLYTLFNLRQQDCSFNISIFPQCKFRSTLPSKPDHKDRIYFWHQADQQVWIDWVRHDKELTLMPSEINRITLLNPFSEQVIFLVAYSRKHHSDVDTIRLLLELLSKRSRYYYTTLLKPADLNDIDLVQSHLDQITLGKSVTELLPRYNVNFNREPIYFANLMYHLGLSFYDQRNLSLTQKSLSLAVKLAPDWSPFYIELANYYRLQNQPELANQVLLECQKSIFAMEDCLGYLRSDQPIELGNQRQAIHESLAL